MSDENDTMVDEQVWTETPAPASATPLAPTDAGGSDEAATSPSLAKTIRDAAYSAADKAKGFITGKNKGGRPPKPGSKYSAWNSDGTARAAGDTAGDAPVPDDVRDDLAKKSIAAVVKTISGFFARKLSRKASRAGLRAGEVKSLLDECKPSEEEIEAVGDLAAICLKKYGVGDKYMPEVGLVACVAQIGMRYAQAMGGLPEAPKNTVPMPKQ